jgi:N6-adenosine-specific RNA methylase IME4
MTARLPRIVGGFQLLLCDPPWRFESFDGESSVPTQAADPYDTMTLDELMDMNVRGVAAKNSLLAMWTIGTHLEMALRLGRVWGFSYVTDLFIWDKDKMGMGYHTRKQAELCLLFKRGNGVPVKSHSVRQIIRAPKRQHSRKPDEQYDALDALYGTHLRRLELFARQERPGWRAWGNETAKFAGAPA